MFLETKFCYVKIFEYLCKANDARRCVMRKTYCSIDSQITTARRRATLNIGDAPQGAAFPYFNVACGEPRVVWRRSAPLLFGKTRKKLLMKVLLIILCIAVIIWLANSRKKIDEQEKVALRIPGTAERLREHYGKLVSLLTTETAKHEIVFERKYDESIRLRNREGQELFMSYSGIGQKLHVVCIKDSLPVKEWTFDKATSSYDIYQEISEYFS